MEISCPDASLVACSSRQGATEVFVEVLAAESV
jgi:hypothetical protein